MRDRKTTHHYESGYNAGFTQFPMSQIYRVWSAYLLGYQDGQGDRLLLLEKDENDRIKQ